MKLLNNFHESLKQSENAIPLDFYKSIFGSGSLVETIPAHTELQTQGADVKITCPSGRVFYCEEKIRQRDFDDLLLETKSCVERNTPGWIEKPSIADFLVYFCQDSKRVFVLKMKEIQNEYSERKAVWLDRGRVVTADNGFYTSRNVAVPWGDVQSRVFTASLQQN